MSSYSELIKNFEKIRAYMREFYIYGFKNRSQYSEKSARSYDDERRRVESWLGDLMKFVRTPEGKNVFISVDSRVSACDPLYKAWKTKSFTDGDITLHFILFDILFDPSVSMTVGEIVSEIDLRLSVFTDPMTFDESTVRKKLKEYIAEGLVVSEKKGRSVYYRRAANDCDIPSAEVLQFFSEAAPCGVVGSFLLDKTNSSEYPFLFKHHYITSSLDSDVLASFFDAMGEKRFVTFVNKSSRGNKNTEVFAIPLRVLSSAQNGRQHIVVYRPKTKALASFRLDYIADVKKGDVCERFDEYRELLALVEPYTWGVSIRTKHKKTETVDFTVFVGDGERYIIDRLNREKRVGTVEKIDERHYRFHAEVFDSFELVPWIRTFICRITELKFSNRQIEKIFRNDLSHLYAMYGVEKEESQT